MHLWAHASSSEGVRQLKFHSGKAETTTSNVYCNISYTMATRHELINVQRRDKMFRDSLKSMGLQER